MILWVKEFRAAGKQTAMPMGGRRRFALLGERDWLLARVAAAQDLIGRALRTKLAERGTKVSYNAVWRFLREERLTFKKEPAPPSRIGRTSLESASGGSGTSAELTQLAWCLSTKPGPRPI